MSTALKSLVFILTIALTGCNTASQAAGTDDGGPADTPSDADNSLAAFCQGATAKVQQGSTVITPAAVSSSELVMNCCTGVVVRFHVPAAMSSRINVFIRAQGGAMPTGDLDLANPPKILEVTIAQDGTPVTAGLTGTVRVDTPTNDVDPSHASLCAELHAPGSTLDGVRLYVSNFPVSSWGWQDRLQFRLLSDSTITAHAAANTPLANLVLATEPVISLTSIAWYVGNTHQVFWDQLATTAALRNRVGQVGTQGVPFVVEADGQRIYQGAFYSLISSESFAGPTIVMEHLTDQGFTIDPAYPSPAAGGDLRSDPRILKVLTEAGKLVP